MPLYYLSEMPINFTTGGGLTIKRILKEDIDKFDAFFHVERFGYKLPIEPTLKEKGVNLYEKFGDKYSLPSIEKKVWQSLKMPWRSYFLKNEITDYAQRIYANYPLQSAQMLVVPQGRISVGVSNWLYRKQPFDYISWIMDDHVIAWKNNNWFYDSDFKQEFGYHLSNARKVFVISPAMQELYKALFGIESEVLHGSADLFPPTLYASPNQTDTLHLAYLGGLLSWQIDALKVLAQALLPLNGKLFVYSHHKAPTSLTDIVSVVIKEAIPPHEVMPTMRLYDGLVIPCSFSLAERHLTALNLSTKMSECLASGNITICIGPEYAAMCRFLVQNECGVVITSTADFQLLNHIKNTDFRQPYLDKAISVVSSQMSNQVMQNKWRRAFYELTNRSQSL
jgi:hypothetical protein